MKKLLCALVIGFAVLALGTQAADSASAPATIHMTNYAFVPQSVTVHTGDTVIFENDDDVTHNVTSDAFKSGDVDAGKSWKHTFNSAGTYSYVCTYHPGMKGTITVSDS